MISQEIPLEFTYETKSPPGGMRPDAYGIVTAYGSPHLARKAEQVPQGLRDIGSSKRTCPLCSITEKRSCIKSIFVERFWARKTENQLTFPGRKGKIKTSQTVH